MGAKPDGTFGWDEWIDKINPDTLGYKLKKAVELAFKRIGRVFEDEAVERIRSKEYDPNSELTYALKGSRTPLIDRGALARAITSKVVAAATGTSLYMGVNSPKTKGGRLLYWVLHDGGAINVTPQMLRAVLAKLQKMKVKGGGKDPDEKKANRAAHKAQLHQLRKGLGSMSGAKAVWVIPPRPFLRSAWESPVFIAAVEHHLEAAISSVFAKMPPAP